MQTIAILAPTEIEATPAQRARAHRATLEQMMLLARGLPIDSPAVRNAAALVGSALAPDPVEYELAMVDGPCEEAPSRGRSGAVVDARGVPARSSDRRRERHDYPNVRTEADWQRSQGYARYLRTIMSAGQN